MIRSSIISLSLLLLAALHAGAGEYRQIELTDGSVLSGEVLSYQNGTYTIRTDALGTVSIDDSQVRSIGTPGRLSASAPPSSPDLGGVGSLQQQMRSDEEVMDLIRALKDDPAFRQILEDKEIMRAVSSNDLAALMANPKFLELLNNSKVLEIQKKVIK